MIVLETERLALRRLTFDDDAFIYRLVNEPSWLEYIGDKGVRCLEDARDYIRNGPMQMYDQYGFGLYLVQLRSDSTALGLCGLIKRDALPDVDIGFAFLPEFWGRGYAFEAASAVLEHGRRHFGLQRIVAITSLHNASSIKLLEKLGMRFERVLDLGTGGPVRLFGIQT
ncbi:MAG TPA: GNAT family N-acetyltransferase [Steroidobacteraceae bacterium]|jgi:RimJ/RimL family protein N-acetyltransferase